MIVPNTNTTHVQTTILAIVQVLLESIIHLCLFFHYHRSRLDTRIFPVGTFLLNWPLYQGSCDMRVLYKRVCCNTIMTHGATNQSLCPQFYNFVVSETGR